MRKAFKQVFINPLLEFIHDSKAIGITLLFSTAISLILSNIAGSIGSAYQHLWNFSFDGNEAHHWQLGFLSLPNSPLLLINDFLMAIFFLMAGMEIKREMLQGELSSIQKSILPVAAAIGGMIAPALLFALFNKGTDAIRGWAIPMATDIAFTLGVASLLGKRVPVSLKIFLTALAIIDDLGAIIVIALFYGGKIQWSYLVAAVIIVLVLYFLTKRKKAFGIFHWLLGIVLWYCMFNSGIHATIAGVVFAFFIPLEKLKTFELKLHVPVYFFIIPLFALANTAIILPPHFTEALTGSMCWGIIVGLLVGKPLGICGISYLFTQKKWASLPNGVSWKQMIGAGILAGIGFTMSIFIATLAYDTIDKENTAKISVLIASAVSMFLGSVWIRFNPLKDLSKN
ncbi:MAG: Na+/H+ antiporter NhaA [Bacteroidota bacterium]|nr:Na+/H+ antiporter NhaA [Bacteroidota bacterium]